MLQISLVFIDMQTTPLKAAEADNRLFLRVFGRNS